VLRVLPGPRLDWLTPDAWTALTSQEWSVTADSNRVGLRLAGPRLDRAREGELPSEGLVPGALQVPPDGAPVLFLADHPVTGGYPVLAVVVTADLPAAAQLRPGDPLRFRAA
jgi:allophanate hydrolase subunit 2